MTRRNALYATFFILFLLGIPYFFFQNKQTDQPIVIAPTPTLAPNTSRTTNVHASDGKVKVILESDKKTDGSTIYTIWTSTIADTDKKHIFTKIEPNNAAIVLPQNAWSPDDTYFFVLENQNNTITALVFKASGEIFTNGQQHLDVTPLFVQRNSKLEITNITGWASPTLLYVLTKADSAQKGPTFWFDISSKSFLQLAG